jgi:tRNA modification GTPase
MFSSDDTIVAIATPAGRGGIGVVRLSGAQARDVASRVVTRRAALSPRRATLTRVRLHDAGAVHTGDHAIVTWFPAPHSYTGEEVVEMSVHGSPIVLRGLVAALVSAGARLARPGEFTFRAFLNARINLTQAEAVADLIEAATPLQAQTAFDQLEGTLSTRIEELDRVLLDLIARLEASLDFPDEGFHFIEPGEAGERIDTVLAGLKDVLSHETRGRLIREGATVVIAGRVNAGKSSLFNALIGHERAIVTDVPGTTRDLLTETVDIDGLAVRLVDTAGEREAYDAVEREGIARAVRARDAADLTLVVIDSAEEMNDVDRRLLDWSSSVTRVVVASKCDRPPKWEMDGAIRVSTLRNAGLSALRSAMLAALTEGQSLRDPPPVSNLRHVLLLKEAWRMLTRARAALKEQGAPEEFVLVDLQRARASLGEVVGVGSPEETLDYIFSRFCVGK